MIDPKLEVLMEESKPRGCVGIVNGIAALIALTLISAMMVIGFGVMLDAGIELFEIGRDIVPEFNPLR